MRREYSSRDHEAQTDTAPPLIEAVACGAGLGFESGKGGRVTKQQFVTRLRRALADDEWIVADEFPPQRRRHGHQGALQTNGVRRNRSWTIAGFERDWHFAVRQRR